MGFTVLHGTVPLVYICCWFLHMWPNFFTYVGRFTFVGIWWNLVEFDGYHQSMMRSLARLLQAYWRCRSATQNLNPSRTPSECTSPVLTWVSIIPLILWAWEHSVPGLLSVHASMNPRQPFTSPVVRVVALCNILLFGKINMDECIPGKKINLFLRMILYCPDTLVMFPHTNNVQSSCGYISSCGFSKVI